jgi:hypothetical protein
VVVLQGWRRLDEGSGWLAKKLVGTGDFGSFNRFYNHPGQHPTVRSD